MDINVDPVNPNSYNGAIVVLAGFLATVITIAIKNLK